MSAPASQSGKAKRDRWVKIAFLAVTVVVALVVWRLQVSPPILAGWMEDLDKARREARDGNRRILLLFIHDRPSDDDRFVATKTLATNDSRIEAGRFLRVKATVPSSMDTPLAKQYGVRSTPTILMLDPNGGELGKRLWGRIGESDFADWLADPNRR
jgi:hypothetical protein